VSKPSPSHYSEDVSRKLSARCTVDGWFFLSENQKSGPFSLRYANGHVNTEDLGTIASKLGVSGGILPDLISEEIRKEMSLADLSVTLETTVKCDEAAKIVTFLDMLLAQTDEDQFNVAFQGLSSGGKSYIPLEIVAYFPEGERREYSHASPQSLYHEATNWRAIQKVAKELDLTGVFDKEELSAKSKIVVYVLDLEKKIVIFVDQPHFQLMERFRSFLSHDRRILRVGITDKAHGGSLRTKIIIIKGYASVFFSSASPYPDEQEKTRAWRFFPELYSEKVKEGLKVLSRRLGNRKAFRAWLSEHLLRNLLQERVRLIRQEGITDIIIPNPDKVLEQFLSGRRIQPRLQRDFPRFLCLIKGIALLNCFHRRRIDQETIEADQKDIDAALLLYDRFALPNELGLSAESWWVYQLLCDMPAAREIGVTRGDILARFLHEFGTPLSMDRLRREILPELESAGLVEQRTNPDDNREVLVSLSPVASPISNDGENTGPEGDATVTDEEIQTAINWLNEPANQGCDLLQFMTVFRPCVLEAMRARGLVVVIRFVSDPSNGCIMLQRKVRAN
jgi:hypothetical protein